MKKKDFYCHPRNSRYTTGEENWKHFVATVL